MLICRLQNFEVVGERSQRRLVVAQRRKHRFLLCKKRRLIRSPCMRICDIIVALNICDFLVESHALDMRRVLLLKHIYSEINSCNATNRRVVPFKLHLTSCLKRKEKYKFTITYFRRNAGARETGPSQSLAPTILLTV